MSEISIEGKLEAMGLSLPEPMVVPKGVKLPFPFVKVHGDLAYISGHLPLEPNGEIAKMTGKVGENLSVEQGYDSAKQVALAVLSSLKLTLGSLDKVKSWLRVFGMVNCHPSFDLHPKVINGFSDLINDLYGDRAFPSRSAVGMASLPFQVPVEVEGVVQIEI